VIWAVLTNNMPSGDRTAAQAVDAFCGGYAQTPNIGRWITP
jgi:hypothetical protein